MGDIDLCRQGVKDDILTWLNNLKKAEFIVVETPENRKGNKFPLRATMLDKLKQDVGGKTSRQVCGTNGPLQDRLHASSQSYNKVPNKFEENIRTRREKKGLSFLGTFVNISFFRISLPLCTRIWVLGIYGESLIQYDDVEASAVLNSIVGNIPTWLDEFTNNLADWNPLFLEKAAQM